MIKKIQEIGGMERIIIESLCAIYFATLICVAAYNFSGSIKFAALAIILATIAILGLNALLLLTTGLDVTAASATFGAATLAALATVNRTPLTIILFFCTICLALIVAAALSDVYKVDDYKKIFLILVIEIFWFFAVPLFFIPYLSVALLAVIFVALLAIFGMISSKLYKKSLALV